MRPLRAFLRLAAGALLVGALAGCAATPPGTARLLADPGALPTRAAVADVPFIPQEENYCGPASLAMALSWSGLPVGQHAVAPQVFTPGREGTLRADMVAAARRNGRLAIPIGRLRDLLAELAAGHPVVVFQNLGLDWYPVWHFAVATGFDLAAGEIRLHSGLESDARLSLATFERTWARGDRWALVVLPPDRLPATADELAVLRAAAGLERAGRPAEAAIAYATVLRRWPDSFGARMGLGNARHAAGDLAGAERAFRAVVARRPDAAPAWNNLAQTLADQGRLDAAGDAARRAVSLGGRDAALYRATLRGIEHLSLSRAAGEGGDPRGGEDEGQGMAQARVPRPDPHPTPAAPPSPAARERDDHAQRQGGGVLSPASKPHDLPKDPPLSVP